MTGQNQRVTIGDGTGAVRVLCPRCLGLVPLDARQACQPAEGDCEWCLARSQGEPAPAEGRPA